MASTVAWKTVSDQDSIDAFADVLFFNPAGGQASDLQFDTSGPVALDFFNPGANSIEIRVLSAVDKEWPDAGWKVDAVTQFSLANNAYANKQIDFAERAHYRVQIKATAGGSQGKLRARICQKRV